MAKKNDAKNLAFIAMASKSIPKIERELAGVINQFDLMIKLSTTKALDGNTLLKEANEGMKRMIQLDKDLTKTISLVVSNSKKLSRDERLKLMGDFRGKVKTLDNKYFSAAAKRAKVLRVIATKRMKETQVSNVSSDPLIVVLRVIKVFADIYKYFNSEKKKLS